MAEIHPVPTNRTSGLSFSGEPLAPEKLETMLEAFRWGPSSGNKQPWRIIVVRSPDAHKRFDEGLSDNNKKWATEAPVKMIVMGNPEEQPPRFDQDRWMLDVGLALSFRHIFCIGILRRLFVCRCYHVLTMTILD